jgi:SAM-dependent methyltransferase
LTELESWYGRDSGEYLLASVRHTLRELLDTSFGYHILQLGSSRGHPLYESSPINHRIYMGERAGQGITVVSRADEIPLESDSIDTVIAHHSLEFTSNPHQVLREIQRVLTPQGQLFIIGFNPYSLLGISTHLRGLSRESLWHQHQPVSERRLTDWLHLLGCEVQDSTRLYGIPPVGRGRLRQWLMRADAWSNRHNLPSGGLYILHAIKQVSAIHRPRRHLRLGREGLIGLVPKPAAAPVPSPNTPVAARHRATPGQGDTSV